MRGLLALVRATRIAVLTQPLTLATLVIFGGAIFLSPYITLFEFYRESHMVREIATASITLWGLLIVVVMSGALVTYELEDRTAVLLLAKPLGRGHFLVGKFLGVVAAVAEGVILLCLVFFFTLWLQGGLPRVSNLDSFAHESAWGYIWGDLVLPRFRFVLQSGLLSILQIAILAAINISLAAFVPLLVSVAGTALFYIVGNVIRYFVVNAEASGSTLVAFVAQGLAYLIPNFAYLNPTVLVSEGGFLRASYLLWVTTYSTIYVSVVLLIASIFFDRREIR